MKRDIILVFIGVAIASIFFYMSDSPTPNAHILDDETRGREKSPTLGKVPANTDVRVSAKPKKIVINKEKPTYDDGLIDKVKVQKEGNNNYNIEMDDGFKFEPITIGSSKEFDVAFEEQEVDHDWKYAVENEILLDFTDALSDKAAWIESYECKYSLCRVELKVSDSIEGVKSIYDDIGQAISELSKVTNTSYLSIPEHSKDKNGHIFFLMRQEVKSNSKS